MTPGVSLESRHALLGGRVSLRALCAGACQWLTPALVITQAARERLAAWVESGGLERTPDLSRLPVYGDARVLPAITAAFTALPPPVAELMVRDVAVFVAGRETHGWTGAAPGRPRVVLLAGDRPDAVVAETFLHEAAHVWCEEWGTQAPTSARFASITAQAHAANYSPRLAPITHIAETRAINLASAWALALPVHERNER